VWAARSEGRRGGKLRRAVLRRSRRRACCDFWARARRGGRVVVFVAIERIEECVLLGLLPRGGGFGRRLNFVRLAGCCDVRCGRAAIDLPNEAAEGERDHQHQYVEHAADAVLLLVHAWIVTPGQGGDSWNRAQV